MFGNVFRMQAAPGKKAEIVKLFTQVDRAVDGAVAFYLFETPGDELWGVAVFRDEKSYRANSASPAQQAEYASLRALLVADPEWHDATDVHVWPGNNG